VKNNFCYWPAVYGAILNVRIPESARAPVSLKSLEC